MSGPRLTDAQIATALRSHLPERAQAGLRGRILEVAESTTQQRSLPWFLGALSDADPVTRRRSLLIAAALLIAMACASAAAVGALRLLEHDPVQDLSLEPPADLRAFVLSSYERLPQLPPVDLTWHDNDSSKGRIYVHRSGAVRFDRFASPEATEPSSYTILRGNRISGIALVESEAVWVGEGHEAFGDDPRVFIRTVLNTDEGPGCEMERDPSAIDDGTAASGWRYVGVEDVAGRPTHHVACVGGLSVDIDLWLDIETRLILRTRAPLTDDTGQPVPGQFRTREVTAIAFGEQPAALFEPPAGVAHMTSEAYSEYLCTRPVLTDEEVGFGVRDCAAPEPEATPRPEATPLGPTTGVWIPTGSMATPRSGHTAVRLLDGRVLVVGGDNDENDTSAELYDPVSGTWSAAGNMLKHQSGFPAILLRDGRVLVGDVQGAEVYDPDDGTWTVTGKMAVIDPDGSSHWGSATLLLDGRALVVHDGGGSELFDPDSGTWTATGQLTPPVDIPTPITLSDGKVLVAGGEDTSHDGNRAALYDPATGTWIATGTMGTPRLEHIAVPLLDGRVLVVGGGFDDQNDTSAELYDPAIGTWSATGSMLKPHARFPATLLHDGRVLVGDIDGAEVYDPDSGTWTVTGQMVIPDGGSATLLLDGTVLVAGGFEGSAELYVPAGVSPPAGLPAAPDPTPTSGATHGGTYVLEDPFPLRLSMTVADGWTVVDESRFYHVGGLTGDDGQTGIRFVMVDTLTQDACAERAGSIDGRASVDDVVAFLAGLSLIDISQNTDVTLDGHRGKYLEFTRTAGQIDCGWGGLDGWPASSPTASDEDDQVWILDVNGVRLVIDAFSSPLDSDGVRTELRQIVESIKIEP